MSKIHVYPKLVQVHVRVRVRVFYEIFYYVCTCIRVHGVCEFVHVGCLVYPSMTLYGLEDSQLKTMSPDRLQMIVEIIALLEAN